MTDQPRFQSVKGTFEEIYPHQHGGRLVSLVLTLVGGGRQKTQQADEIAPANRCDPMRAFDREPLLKSRDFIATRARTQTLRAITLLAFALFLAALIFITSLPKADTQLASGHPGVGLGMAP